MASWPTHLPAEVPSQAAAVARDTLGGAVDVAARLPEELGAALLAAAREAFVQGLQLTAALSAAVAVATAVLATVLLRGVPAGTQAERRPRPPSRPAADLRRRAAARHHARGGRPAHPVRFGLHRLPG